MIQQYKNFTWKQLLGIAAILLVLFAFLFGCVPPSTVDSAPSAKTAEDYRLMGIDATQKAYPDWFVVQCERPDAPAVDVTFNCHGYSGTPSNATLHVVRATITPLQTLNIVLVY